jgi:AraC family transcriptional regulator
MNPTTELTYRRRMLLAQLYIQEHLDEELSLESLAKVVHLSPFHFHRIFKGFVGEGVWEYVRRLRLEGAAMALRLTDKPVTQIAFDSGYETLEAFSRAFRQLFGRAPSRYRSDGRDPEPVTLEPEEPTVITNAVPTPTVRIEQVPPRRVAFMRHIGPYTSVGPTFQKFMGYAMQRGLFRPGALILGLCHDDPDVTPADKIRYDCCLTVGDDFQGEGDVGVQTIEGGEYAIATHRGPYEQLGDVYRWLFGTWLASSGREVRGLPMYEVYLNSPMDTTPDKLITEIHVPLVK